MSLTLFNNITMSSNYRLFSIVGVFYRSYMSPRDKVKYSNTVPSWIDEIMCGVMLGDGNLRTNGKHALLSIHILS